MKTVIRNSYTPKVGDYCETIVVDKESEDAYIFDCDGIFTPMPQPVDVEDILRRAAEYTDETVAPLEEKLDTIEEGAQVNVIETITQNGQPLTVTDKTVNVTVPTKTSDLENDGSDGTDTYVESSTLDDYYTKAETNTQIGYETDAREIADSGLQEQIDAIVASSDVVDIVGTYAALQAYDTTKLHDNDIIKVLTDETRDDATTYYRWDADTSTWSYIGAEGPFYTKAESDALFTPMTRTINGKALTTDIILTAADVHALPDSTVIPTVNDATLTIQKNGTDVATFTANSASNQTANITVPTDTSDLTNDGDGQSPFATEDYVDTYGGKIDTIEVNGTAQPIVNKTVDITVPTKTSDLTNDGSDGTDTYVEAGDLATVATTGDYDDLTNKPTIPTVNDATLTIQKNGTNVATFTANSSTNQTANITVPTDTSDLTNGAGFITSSALSNYYTKSETYSQGEVNSLINSLSIPTKTSDLANDSGFISEDDLYSEVCGSGTTITFQDAPDNAPLSDFKLKGETSQNGTPTPSAPVPVQTVTGENVVKICGKNLWGAEEHGSINENTGEDVWNANRWRTAGYIPVKSNTAYTLSSNASADIWYIFCFYDSGKNFISGVAVYGGSQTQTTPANCEFMRCVVCDTASIKTTERQLELGSTATAYEPYQGQSYPISLGTLELCKIGDYQDSIYKSGGKWYVRKETSKANLATDRTSLDKIGSGTGFRGFAVAVNTGANVRTTNGGVIVPLVCNMLSCTNRNDVYLVGSQNHISVGTPANEYYKDFFFDPAPINGYSVADAETWLNNNPIIVYYPLATPTDTEITNATLIAQLEAILSQGYTYAGTNNITTVISAGNEQGELEICYTKTLLPIATETNLGLVQIGSGLSITPNGVLSATGGGGGSTDWDDITNKPTNVSYWTNDAGYITSAAIPTNVSSFTNDAGYITSAAIPTNVSAFTNDAGYLTSSALSNYYTKSETYNQSQVNSLINSINIPSKTSDLTNDGEDGTSTYVEADDLATVATSGSYNDLTDKPTIPTVNDATLTIQKNGTNVQTFTANASSNKVANIQVPNLQTSNTDPGEGSALAADTFLGIYDVAPEDVDGARITDETITAAKLAGKAKIADVTSATRSFTATDKGVLLVSEPFESSSASRGTAKITFSGASGSTITPRSSATGLTYNSNKVYGLALVDAGDAVTWTTTYSNAGGFPDWGNDHGFSLFIPCNW